MFPTQNLIQKRIDTCICITESLCCTPETNTTLLINYAPIWNENFLKFYNHGQKQKYEKSVICWLAIKSKKGLWWKIFYLGSLSCHILTILIRAANKKKKKMLFSTAGSLDQQNSQSTGQAVFVALPHLLGQPALSLRSLSHHPSTSQWLSNQPKSNTITKGDITQWHSTYYISRSIATGKKATFQNSDSIIFIYFLSFFFKLPTLKIIIFFIVA